MPSIRAVFLDVGWTLAYPQRSIWEIFAALAVRRGATTDARACEQLVRSLWSIGQQIAEEQFHGGRQYSDSDAEFAMLFEQMSALLFSQLGIEGDRSELTREFLAAFWREANWQAFPEVAEVLPQLRARGVRLGVLSNAPTDLPSFLERLGISPHLDFAVVSAIEGVKKPDRRIFEIAIARAGVEPHEALHVGDMYLEDIVGGRAAGVKTLLMERGEHSLFPSYRESDGREPGNPHVIRNLHELLAYLD